jgi:hypothetical protein
MGPAGADASRGPRSPLLCRVRPPPGPGWWVCVWVPTTGPQATATRSASQPNLARWMDGSTWRRGIGRCVVALRAHAGSSLYCIYDVCVCGNIYIYIYTHTCFGTHGTALQQYLLMHSASQYSVSPTRDFFKKINLIIRFNEELNLDGCDHTSAPLTN